MKIINLLLKLLKYLFVLALVILAIGPFLWVLLSSFKTNGEIMNHPLQLPVHFLFSNFVRAFQIAPLA